MTLSVIFEFHLIDDDFWFLSLWMSDCWKENSLSAVTLPTLFSVLRYKWLNCTFCSHINIYSMRVSLVFAYIKKNTRNIFLSLKRSRGYFHIVQVQDSKNRCPASESREHLSKACTEHIVSPLSAFHQLLMIFSALCCTILLPNLLLPFVDDTIECQLWFPPFLFFPTVHIYIFLPCSRRRF